jgi:hypothetical protein
MNWQKLRCRLLSVLFLGLVIADAGRLQAQMITSKMKNVVWSSETALLTVVMIAGQNGVPASGDYSFIAQFDDSGWQGTLSGPQVQLVFVGIFDQASDTGSFMANGVFGNMSGPVTGGVAFHEIGTTRLGGDLLTSCVWPAHEEDTDAKKIWDCASGESAGLVFRTVNGKRQGPPLHEKDQVSWPPPNIPPQFPPQSEKIELFRYDAPDRLVKPFSFDGNYDVVGGTLRATIQSTGDSP